MTYRKNLLLAYEHYPEVTFQQTETQVGYNFTSPPTTFIDVVTGAGSPLFSATGRPPGSGSDIGPQIIAAASIFFPSFHQPAAIMGFYEWRITSLIRYSDGGNVMPDQWRPFIDGTEQVRLRYQNPGTASFAIEIRRKDFPTIVSSFSFSCPEFG